jgi:hypothetical protein
MTSEMTRLYTALARVCMKYLGKSFILTSSDRTCARERELGGGDSYHVNGQAFDAKVSPYTREDQAFMGRLAETQGYRWGGRFKGNYDDVHFDNGNRSSPGRCP